MAKWGHSLEWITPVPVSVSRILHKNSPLAIKTTYLSLSFVSVICALLCILNFCVQHFQFPNLYFENRQPFSPHFSLLCSANLPFVLWGEPRNQGSTLRLYFVTHCAHECTLRVDFTLLHIKCQVSISHCVPNVAP